MLQNKKFYEFENAAIMKSINNIADTQTREIIFEQYQNAAVILRKFDKVGFFTYFEIPYNLRRLPVDVPPFGDIVFDINDLKDGVGFVVFTKNGALNMVECYTNAGYLPDEIKYFKQRT